MTAEKLQVIAQAMFSDWHLDYQAASGDERHLIVCILVELLRNVLKKHGVPADEIALATYDAAVLAVLTSPPAAAPVAEPLHCARLIGADGRAAVAALLARAGCHGRPAKEGPRRRAKGVRHA